MPPLLGWAAVTGDVTYQPLLLFLIIFAWTPPHFWALAIARRDEYARAGIPMLPVTHGLAYTRLQVLLYTVLLVLVTLMPFLTRMSGLIYLAAALALNAGFLYYALALKITAREELPMRVFRFSVTYLMWLFGRCWWITTCRRCAAADRERRALQHHLPGIDHLLLQQQHTGRAIGAGVDLAQVLRAVIARGVAAEHRQDRLADDREPAA